MKRNAQMEKNCNKTFSDPIVWFFSLRLFDKLVILLTAFLLLSPFGEHFLLQFQGRYFFEVGFMAVVLMLLFRRTSLILELKRILLQQSFIIALLISLLLLGIFVHGDVLSAYSDFRAIFILLVSFQYFVSSKKSLEQEKCFLYVIALFSMLFYISFFYTGLSVGVSSKEIYPFLAIPLMLYLSTTQKWPFYLFIAVLLGAIIALRSFYRSNWIIYGFSIFLFVPAIVLFQFSERKFFKVILTCLWVCALVFIGIEYFNDIIGYLSSTEGRYIQSIVKWNELVDFLIGRARLSDSDYLRYCYYVFIIKYWHTLLLPSGLGFDHLIYNVHSIFSPSIPGNTIDSAFLFMAIHFGLILSAILFVKLSIHFLKRLLSSSSAIEFVCIAGAVTSQLMYATITGVMFVNITIGFFTGGFLGIVLNPNDQWSWRCRSEGKDNRNMRLN